MGIVYVLSNPVMPGLVKIGCTDQAEAGVRISQLYTTGVPVPFKIEFAAQVDDTQSVEDALHQAFAPYRINPKREFFRVEPEQPIAILKLLHIQDATSGVSASSNAGLDDQSRAALEQQRKRRPNFNFAEMGIEPGSVLYSTQHDITVTVLDSKKVSLNGEPFSLSAATKAVMQTDTPLAPGFYWTYNGRLLRDIYNDTYTLDD